MDVLLDEDEEMIRDTARRFFDAECDSGRIRDNEDSSRRNDADLWRQLAAPGRLGPARPGARAPGPGRGPASARSSAARGRGR